VDSSQPVDVLPPYVQPAPALPNPAYVGRYRVERLLGEGGFGRVYLARDEQLRRLVAVKVPHPRLVSRPGDAEPYLAEARTVAGLDHPNIVPVYDVGSTQDCPCFVVSKYIDGTDLATRLRQSLPTVREAAELAATVADALHHAHKQGLVHRDVKPGNILLDRSDKPFLADFGLALSEQDAGRESCHAGTPAYMSPEQARGEGHRVDGRSDIFSLGIVLYELLTGQRPFCAESWGQLFEQITAAEARPPRQIDDRIPRELDRICLKALSKRASERHTTARDLAEDLRHFLAETPAGDRSTATIRQPVEAGPSTPTPLERQALKIVPKGLRSFDVADADFFLELLPGPRDREGLPDSIRFWKAGIEAKDPDRAFAVGLIYGPSGCGKSSLVKAGLLPRLAPSVTAVYVEATARDTEARLLKALRRQVVDLPGDLGLTESLAALRRGRFLEPGHKVLLVLDQFEQWLHARREEGGTDLLAALRQCDGGRVQCVVLVRDDFWMAATRFMADLEVNLSHGHNCAAVDLFDLPHARKVLADFGRAYGRLPNDLGECTREHGAFLDRAVAGVAQEDKVIPVRLALFAEMVKGKPWIPATLREVGGTEGVGVTFLEETFAGPSAPPQHRLHQKAAQAVLKALLPEAGTDLKGHMRSHKELLEASGHANRPGEFDELLRILDSELRLITPADPETVDGGADASPATVRLPPSTSYYQLTHDYLVPSLRDWLSRKQKETSRGRAELLLADRAAVWSARPENRQLPSLLQWLQVRWLTRARSWTPPQRRMMRKATRYHVARGLVLALVVALLGGSGYAAHGWLKARDLRDRLLDANTADVPGVVADMAPYRRWLDPLLYEANHDAEANHDPRKQLHASLALLPVDQTQVEYLYGRLLEAEPHQVPVIRDALAARRSDLVDRLWAVVLARPEKGKEQQRLRAAAALAGYDPDSSQWDEAGDKVVEDLVSVNAVYLGLWSEAFRPVKAHLLSPLSNVFRDRKPERAVERTQAMNLLADYAADRPDVLADLLMDADEREFAELYPKFQAHGERGLPVLREEVDRKLPADAGDEAREKLAKRQANAAVVLLRLGAADQVWPLLRRGTEPDDPRVRSYLIHRFGPLGAEAGAIVKRLEEEPDVTIRRALILSLGPEEFGEDAWPPGEKERLVRQLRETYRTAADPGLRASAEWLLRQWKEEAWLARAEAAWAGDKDQRDKRLAGIRTSLHSRGEKTGPQWYVTGQGQTMVVVPGPVEFVMGSPPLPEARPWIASRQQFMESRHRMSIDRHFAIAATPVTKEQFLRFLEHFEHVEMRRYPDPTCPIGGVKWELAAMYCNWLSLKEGIEREQLCYETDVLGVRVTRLKENYLSLDGYRLPSEAEWEYACRAGATTSRYYGESAELLGKYAWYSGNSGERSWPVGSKKPNDLGLFDMHGNVWSWCQESYKDYPEAKGDKVFHDREDTLGIEATRYRASRGGSFDSPATDVRCAFRHGEFPLTRYFNGGFRPARTIR
jgi:serine/threonine protein kinase/formylglycine-generating enzyme required for sulfatase activity